MPGKRRHKPRWLRFLSDPVVLITALLIAAFLPAMLFVIDHL